MGSSGPAYPLPLPIAWKILWVRFAEIAGLDDLGNWLSPDHVSNGNDYDELIARAKPFARAQDESHLELETCIATGRIIVWKTEGSEWRPLPPEWAHEQFGRTGTGVHLYVDRPEFESEVLARHPAANTNVLEATATFAASPPEGPRRPRGRPSGKKYGKSDAVLVKKMRDLIKSGKAPNPTDAANQLAHLAAGPATVSSKARRLYREYRLTFGWERKGN